MRLASIFQGNKNKSERGRDSAGARDTEEPIVIIDIGCRWGFAERFLDEKYHHSMKIFGFDPDESECERLLASYSQLPSGFINCIPVALAGKQGKRNLYITKEPACSSLHPPIKELSDHYPALACTTLERVTTVDVFTLGDWIRENHIRSVDYIKVDTQGSELEILKGGDEYLETARCIDIEVEFNPIYEGQSLFSETDIYLREKGFVLWRFSNMVHYSPHRESIELRDTNAICFDENVRQEMQAFGGQLFWADARYVNSKVIQRNLIESESQRKRDALLFEALGMPDVLRHIDRKMEG